MPTCQNLAKCSTGSGGHPCKQRSHAGHTQPCTNWATSGPGNTRVYCAGCVTFLKLRDTHHRNSQRCLDCGKSAKHRIGSTPDLLCMACANARLAADPNQVIQFANDVCEKCRRVSASRASDRATRPRRCALCSPPDWVSKTNLKKRKGRAGSGGKRTRAAATLVEKKLRVKRQYRCLHEGCAKSKLWGYESDRKLRVCAEHTADLEPRTNDPVVQLIEPRRCVAHCRVAKFGISETTHCSICRSADMEKLASLCAVEGCEADPRFGTRNLSTGRGTLLRCSRHRTPPDLPLGAVLCKYRDHAGDFVCNSRATYGIGRRDRCALHKRPGSVEMTHSHLRCQADECTVRATFGMKGGKATRCFSHKTHDMVDVASKRCRVSGCWEKAVVAVTDGNRPTHCRPHGQ